MVRCASTRPPRRFHRNRPTANRHSRGDKGLKVLMAGKAESSRWTLIVLDRGQRGRLMTVKRLRVEILCPLSSVLCPQLANHSKNQPTTHQPQRNHHETEHQLERTRDSAPQGHLAGHCRSAYGRDCRDGHRLHVHGHPASGTTEIIACGIPAIAWTSHSSQMAENCGEDTNAPTNAIKQVVPITTVIGRRLIRHS